MTRKRKLATAVTGLFALGMLPGAVMNIAQPPLVLEMTTILGIPAALLTLVGIWKLLGIAALLAPGFPRLREWAYAGFFFDLTGAAYLHAVAGDTAGSVPSLVLVAGLVASYLLRRRAAEGDSTNPALAPA